jgi:DNA invertase Pin-like site-specific DNA recombinase
MQNNGKKLRLVGYVRCSTEGQVDRFGLETQRQAISSWAKANGHRVIEVVSDDAVAGTVEALEREGLAAAIDAVQQGRADGLVCARLDRLARSLTVQEAALGLVWQAEGRVFTADSGEVAEDDADDPMRTALRQIVGAIAQLDRALITKRLRDGRRVKAEEGGFVGGAPRYGVRAVGGELVEDPAEAVVVARMMALRSSGSSLNAIARTLNSEGVPTKRGGRWTASSVSRVVDSEARERARRRAEVARGRRVA